jgi:hypothetical protein
MRWIAFMQYALCAVDVSEQGFRVMIRGKILHLGLRVENATKQEIQILKAQGVLGRRAPSCSCFNSSDWNASFDNHTIRYSFFRMDIHVGMLLSGPDMIKLLESYSKDTEALQLKDALSKKNYKLLAADEMAEMKIKKYVACIVLSCPSDSLGGGR